MNCLVVNTSDYACSGEHIVYNNSINNDNDNKISSKYILEPFRQLLHDLIKHNGWQFVTVNQNTIIMNRRFYELDEISIQYKNSQYHFSLPIPNSVYSYYKKFTHGNNDTNTEIALHFLKSYTNTLTSYLY